MPKQYEKPLDTAMPSGQLEALAKAICTEEGLPLTEYSHIISLDLEKVAPLIENVFLRRSIDYLEKGFAHPDKSATWIEKLIAQRLAADYRKLDLSLDLSVDLLTNHPEMPEIFQLWTLYFRAKALQRLARYTEAQYVYRELEQLPLPELLNAFVQMDKILLYHNCNRPDEALRLLKQFEPLIPKILAHHNVAGKVGSCIGLIYSAYGDLSHSITLLRGVVQLKGCDPYYIKRATCFLFQTLVDAHDFQSAGTFLPQCILWAKNNAFADLYCYFLTYWFKWEMAVGDPNRGDEILRLAKETKSYASDLKYKVDVFVNEAMVNPFRPQEFLTLLRQCRKNADHYSRGYLWLEMIRQGHMLNRKSKQMVVKVLRSIHEIFKSQHLKTEKLRSECLLFLLNEQIPPMSWFEEIIDLGHSYLLLDWARSHRPDAKMVILLDKSTAKAYLSNGKIVSIGKDQTMIPLLCHLNQCPGHRTTIEELLRSVYQEPTASIHSIKKVQVAAARINKKLLGTLLIVKSQEISINPQIAVVVRED